MIFEAAPHKTGAAFFMAVRTDKVAIQITVNGNEAQNSLNELRKRAANLSVEIAGLKKGTQEYINKNKELEQVKSEMNSLKETIGLTSLSLKELNREKAKLTSLRGSVSPLSEDFKKYDQQLQAVTLRQKDLTAGTKAFSAAGQVAGSSFSNLSGSIAKGFATFFAIEKVIDLVKTFTVDSVKEFNESEEAVLGLHLALENVGRLDVFAGLLSAADEFAEKYKRLDNDDITNVFTKLVDYGKLTQTQIKQTAETIIEYAAKQKISLTEATDVITKSFEGNSKGLKTYGINIKDATTFTERYNLVNGELYNKIKGTEAALEATNKGAWEVFKQKIRDIQETIGRFISSLSGMEKQQTQTAIQFKKEGDSAQVLVSRYEELSKKVNKAAEDKNELRSITSTLVSTFGSSVIQINKESGALELNISATKDLIKQKLLLANSKAAEVAAKYNKAVEDENSAIEKQKLLYKALGDQKNAVNNQTPDQILSRAINPALFGLANVKKSALDESKLSTSEKGVLNLVRELNQFRLAKRKASEDNKLFRQATRRVWLQSEGCR